MIEELPAMSQRERNRVRTRNDILDVAAQLLGDVGYSGTTLQEISKLAGVARGTVYAYFPAGRDEIVRAVYLRLADEVVQRGNALHAQAEGLEMRIRALARALTEASADPKGRFYGIMGADLVPVLAGVTGTASRSFENFIRDDLVMALHEGLLIPGIDIEALTVALSGALRASGSRAAADPESVEEQINALGALARGLITA
ncbi:TetR/AcrR family transcriptional regulator [Glutamicibacter halophytocola]|uniref:TetR/AcrR family transcriptional regulator n=1 Tax=Glutamicibacter halophytocola TaxID=1933880 RepID=A0AA94XTW5_9MICC|nr:TetR/AcrR family transcriptional regulator [Glutamicibacter halophytocola]UUX58764.1 TetR/AcrR family transcriptional regulator [Glutamicibacter halophytocola]